MILRLATENENLPRAALIGANPWERTLPACTRSRVHARCARSQAPSANGSGWYFQRGGLRPQPKTSPQRRAETLSFFVFLSEPLSFSSSRRTSLLIPFFSRGA